MLGVLVNGLAILLGGALGCALGGRVAQRFRETAMQGLALCVIAVGLYGVFAANDPMALIVSLVLGGLIGEAANIEGALNRLGDAAQARFAKGENRFAEGFVTTSLIYCVGAMAVVGSLKAGLNGDNSTLFAKSALDGVSAVFFASTLGIGVLFSAAPVLIYQGIIVLFAGAVAPLMPAEVVAAMSSVGGLLIMAIGLNMLGISRRINVGNLLPAIFIPAVYIPLYNYILSLAK